MLIRRLTKCFLSGLPKSIWATATDVIFCGNQSRQNVVYLIQFDDGFKYIGSTSRLSLSEAVVEKYLDQNSTVSGHLASTDAKIDKVQVLFQSDCQQKLKEMEAQFFENYSLFYSVLNEKHSVTRKSLKMKSY